MVVARYIEDRWLKPLREKRKQEREKLRQKIREEVEQEVREEVRQEIREAVRQKARQKGREEEQARWEAWLTGMRQAREKGKSFDEPPPGPE